MWNPTVHYNQHYAWQQIDIVQKNGEELKKKYNSPKYITNTASYSLQIFTREDTRIRGYFNQKLLSGCGRRIKVNAWITQDSM